MIKQAQEISGRVIDLDALREVKAVIWVDVEGGMLEAYQLDSRGRKMSDGRGNWLTYRAGGRFKLLPLSPRNIPAGPKVSLGAERCVICRSPLTLSGDDLCPLCKSKDKGYKLPVSVEKILNPLLDRPCEVKYCGRLAEWSVGDEVDVSPVDTKKVITINGHRLRGVFGRAATVNRHWYCSFHYVPPRLLDVKGEVVTTFEEAGGVRPQ